MIPSWLYISQTAGTSGTTVITLSAGTNDSGSLLTNITVNSNNIEKNVYINQYGSYLYISPTDYLYLPQSGGNYTFSVSSDTSWEVTNYSNWFSISPTSGTGNQTLTMTVNPNNSYTKREKTFELRSTAKSIVINVSQLAKEQEFDYSNDYFTVLFEGSGVLNVTAINFNGIYPSSQYIRTSYKINNTWHSNVDITSAGTQINVSNGDILYFNVISRGDGGNLQFNSSANHRIRGNIMSLVYDKTFWQYYDLTKLTNNTKFTYMFYNDVGLIDAKGLVMPATALTADCYTNMFNYCTSLTTAPTLPATDISSTNCYGGMFGDCSSLNYIKCLATTGIDGYTTWNWVSGVAASGTFVKKAGVSWPTGSKGIPNGWTIQEV